MAVIGNFGSRIIFETSDKKILTFSGMSQKVSGKYAKHSVTGQKDRPEFTGPGNRSISFKIMLDVSLGMRPSDVMSRIEDAVENGEAEYLVVGGRPIGRNKFYISSVSEAFDVIMSRGDRQSYLADQYGGIPVIDLKEAVIYLDGFSNDEAADIRRCLNALYSVREGEQPLDRDFGLSWEFLDQPVPIAQNLLALEIIKKTSRYEPRVSVDKVEYEHGNEGQLIPIIHLKRGGI